MSLAALRSTSPDAKRSGVQSRKTRMLAAGSRDPLRGPGKVGGALLHHLDVQDGCAAFLHGRKRIRERLRQRGGR